MKLCPSVVMRILVECRSQEATQRKLGSSLVGTLGTTDGVDYYNDAGISDLVHGKNNFGPTETAAAIECDKRDAVERFAKGVLPLLDPSKLRLVVVSIKAVVARDASIPRDACVDLVGGLTKGDMCAMQQFSFTDLVEGVFLSSVAHVGNRDTRDEVSEVTAEFLESLSGQCETIVLSDSNRVPELEIGRTLWRRGPNAISVATGDIFAVGEDSAGMRPIAVIPVDTTFVTHLGDNVGAGDPSLVSRHTLHGQWLSMEYIRGMTPEGLERRIAASLATRYELDDGEAPIGAVVPVDDGDAVYYLLAIARLDSHGNTQSSAAEIAAATSSLAGYYGANGQGLPLRVPLMGTGRSRARLGYRESFETIFGALVGSADCIFGRVSIVAEPEAAHELDIERLTREEEA